MTNELVSRQAVLDGTNGLFCEEWVKVLFKTMVKQLPPVEPKRLSGKWIERPHFYECSKCRIIRAKGITGKYNFCPNCGADMRGDTDG